MKMQRSGPKWALLFFLGLQWLGCATTPAPSEDYALAKASLDAARIVEAARHAPTYWGQAEEAYLKAVSDFEQRDFSSAKEGFQKARSLAEKAETAARILRMKNGEVL